MTTKVKKKTIIKVVILIGLFFFFYLGSLYNDITSKFDYHRWNIPSRVYSDSLPLYEGVRTSPASIIAKLKYLNYKKKVGDQLTPGAFDQNSNYLDIYLHQFPYPDENFEGFPLRIKFQSNRIEELVNLETSEKVEHVRLEPELIGSIFDQEMEDRTFVRLDEVPQNLINAIISVEDKRFYSHFGVDPRGIFRSMVKNLFAGRIVQGGSTVTQQLVKNFFLHSRKSLVRKINEAFMAIMLELRYSKEDIMESYLNEIYLGQNGSVSIAGVQSAAQFHFSKDVNQLSLAECAQLAGMIQSPGYFLVNKNPNDTLKRRNLVLSLMQEQGYITAEQRDEAKEKPLMTRARRRPINRAPFFVQRTLKELKDNFPKETLESDGLLIFTTLDMTEQRAAQRVLKSKLEQIENSRTYLKNLKAKEGKQLEGALVSLQPQTGYIRAYVGGRNFATSQFDHVSQAKRQPGSSIKPFVYLAALNKEREEPYTLSTFIDDGPLKSTQGGKVWRPQNYDHKNHGYVRFREALEKSYNVSTVRLAMDVGLGDIVDLLQKAGIESELKPYPSLALGAFEVSPLEMAQAYTLFPNEGVATKAIGVLRVVTPEGKVLDHRELQMKAIVDPKNVFLINEILKGVIQHGTAASARGLLTGILAGGKTGTTSDYRDAWFAGFTRKRVALSWVGYDDGTPTNLSGASGALPIWADYIAKTHGRLSDPPDHFFVPEGLVQVSIDEKTGLRFKKKCGNELMEYYIDGTQPTKKCTSYYEK